MKVIKLVVFFCGLALLFAGCSKTSNQEDSIVYLEKDLDKVWPIGDPTYAQTSYDRTVAKDIINGGYVLVFRHPHRQKWIDVTMYDALELLDNRKAENEVYKNAVCLSPEQGLAQAQVMGKFVEKIKLPYDRVISSPSCRARQLALLAFNRIDSIEPKLLHFYGDPYGPFDSTGSDGHFKDIKKFLAGIEVKPGNNVIISAHNNTIIKDIIDAYDNPKNRAYEKPDFLLEEGGFHVVKISDGKLVYYTKFHTFNAFANKFFDKPLSFNGQGSEK